MQSAQHTSESRATQRSRRKICADAVAKMQTIIDELEECGDADVEVKALRKQLRRIERVSSTIDRLASEAAGEAAKPSLESSAKPNVDAAPEPSDAAIALDGDPHEVARKLVALIPLDNVCQDNLLMDAFLSEMFLAVAYASTREKRGQRAAEGITAARARGVQFGRPRNPLPDNFNEARYAFRSKKMSLKQAAEFCGMAETSFHTAVRRAENTESETF